MWLRLANAIAAYAEINSIKLLLLRFPLFCGEVGRGWRQFQCAGMNRVGR